MIACKLTKLSFINSSGINQPPVNKIALKELIITIEQYSPKKKNTKIIAECSVKNPATNSDSRIKEKFYVILRIIYLF